MILRKLPVLFFFLLEALNAADPSIRELEAGINQLLSEKESQKVVLANTEPVNTELANAGPVSKVLANTELTTTELTNTEPVNTDSVHPSLSAFEISKHENELTRIFATYNIETAVEMIEERLSKILKFDHTLVKVTEFINSIQTDVKILVLTAKKLKSYNLLRILATLYNAWSAPEQFHWFLALSYNSSWYDPHLWPTDRINWKDNLWAVCETDNDALSVEIATKIVPEDLEKFTGELLMLCAEYDAIKVFEIMKFDPIQLGAHLELMAINSSTKLIRVYQAYTKVKHLHLENFSFPKKLPDNIIDLDFLMGHGYNCYPIDWYTFRSCKEGRLDILEYIYGLDQEFVPNEPDLGIAAENGHVNILIWAFQQLKLIEEWDLENFAVTLAVNQHIQALDTWLRVSSTSFNQKMIRDVVLAGALEALQWIYEKQFFNRGEQEWIDLATENGHFLVIKWLHSEFRLFPNVEALEKAHIALIKRIRPIGKALDRDHLAHFEEENLNFLQWIVENTPPTILNANKQILASNVLSKKAMEWLFDEFKLCPLSMDWAYEIDDLETIQWAMETCKILPTFSTICIAAKRGHEDLILWIHKNFLRLLKMTGVVETIVENGHAEIIMRLPPGYFFLGIRSLNIDPNMDVNQRLSILAWVHQHGFFPIQYTELMEQAAIKGELPIIEWVVKAFPSAQPLPDLWQKAAINGRGEFYMWLLENYPRGHRWGGLREDFELAYLHGHLGIVKILLAKVPSLAKELPGLKNTRNNYHIVQWLATDGNVEEMASGMFSWFQSMIRY